MKKIFFTMLLVLAASLFVGCKSSTNKEREKCIAFIKSTLKDPNSLEIFDEKFEMPYGGSSVIEWEFDFGARNSFGGMVRNKIYLQTFSSENEVQYFKYDKSELWKSANLYDAYRLVH